MSKIQDFLKSLLTSKLGKDVRQGIHDSIEQCYKDATGHPESVAAVVKDNEDIKKLVEETPYCEYEETIEMKLPVHSINDDIISDSSTWSSKRIDNDYYKKEETYSKDEVYSKRDIDNEDFAKNNSVYSRSEVDNMTEERMSSISENFMSMRDEMYEMNKRLAGEIDHLHELIGK